MFDQELDVPQAITRQRLKSNPFNDKFIFILNKKDMEAKIKGLEKKYIETVELLKDVVSGANCLKDNNENVNLAYETYKGYYMLESDSYVVNESLLLAKKYAFKELFAQYDTGYDVRGKFSKGKSIKVDSFKAPTFADYSKKIQNAETVSEKLSIIETIHNENWKTWLRYGVGKGKVLINNKEAKAFFESRNDYKGVILAIHKAFKPNTRYTIKEVRIKLSEIYKVKDLDKKIKASDLNEFFEVQYKKAKVEGKVIRVVQIIRPL